MSNTLLEKFFSILFKMPDGRSMETYFKSVAMITPVATSDLKSGKTFPADGLLTVSSIDGIAEYFQESSQIYKEAVAKKKKKSNNQTPSQIQYLLVYKKGDDDTYTEALNKAKAINTKFAQVTMTSKKSSYIRSSTLSTYVFWILFNAL